MPGRHFDQGQVKYAKFGETAALAAQHIKDTSDGCSAQTLFQTTYEAL